MAMPSKVTTHRHRHHPPLDHSQSFWFSTATTPPQLAVGTSRGIQGSATTSRQTTSDGGGRHHRHTQGKSRRVPRAEGRTREPACHRWSRRDVAGTAAWVKARPNPSRSRSGSTIALTNPGRRRHSMSLPLNDRSEHYRCNPEIWSRRSVAAPHGLCPATLPVAVVVGEGEDLAWSRSRDGRRGRPAWPHGSEGQMRSSSYAGGNHSYLCLLPTSIYSPVSGGAIVSPR